MKILVWKNKYDDQYYDASTPEALETSAKKILETLFRDGWLSEPSKPTFSPEDEEVMALSEEAVEALPKAVKSDVVTLRDRLKHRTEAYEYEMKDWRRTQAVLAGETDFEVILKRHASVTDEEWAARCERVQSRHPQMRVTESCIERPVTALQILSDRNGAEYENYYVEDVITA